MTHYSINNITALVVSHDTTSLLERAISSFRRFHPDMRLIIVDGSTTGGECYNYVQTLADDLTDVYRLGYNIGHGRGMHFGIERCETPLALIFDSDVEFIKSPVAEMLKMMTPETYGVGYVEKTAYDGFEYGSKPQHRGRPFMYMLHPFFQLLQISQYRRFQPYVHHGAPCFKAALDIHKKGLTSKIIKIFPGLGHTSGKGWVWDAVPPVWIRHDTAGTRTMRVERGQIDIEGRWER